MMEDMNNTEGKVYAFEMKDYFMFGGLFLYYIIITIRLSFRYRNLNCEEETKDQYVQCPEIQDDNERSHQNEMSAEEGFEIVELKESEQQEPSVQEISFSQITEEIIVLLKLLNLMEKKRELMLQKKEFLAAQISQNLKGSTINRTYQQQQKWEAETEKDLQASFDIPVSEVNNLQARSDISGQEANLCHFCRILVHVTFKLDKMCKEAGNIKSIVFSLLKDFIL